MSDYSHFGKELVSLQDDYPFECKKCGKCCKNRNDVLLNGRDVWNLARFLNITSEEFISKYCTVYIGKSSRLPVVTLRPVGQALFCPFLHNNLCSVQEAKPTVCALFPLGRIIHNDALEDGDFKNPTVEYFKMDCPNKTNSEDTSSSTVQPEKKEQQSSAFLLDEENDGNPTVESWLKSMGVETPDSFYVSWTNMICSMCLKVVRIEKEAEPGVIRRVWDLLFSAMYLWYNPQAPFEEQFVANMLIADEFVKQATDEIKKNK